MASQDVIELGSSDDEPEPAQKKAKQKKPPLNAMVHIPSNLSGITIKKTKHNGQSLQAHKPQPLVSKAVKIVANKGFKPVSIPVAKGAQVKSNINPLKFMQTINNAQVQIKKIRPTNIIHQAVAMKRTGNPSPKTPHNVLRAPMTIGPKGVPKLNQIVKTTNLLKNIYASGNPQPQGSKSLSHLPPGITVKQVKPINHTTQATAKRPIKRPISMPVAKKPKPNPPPGAVGEVLTVELDDDDSSASTNSPQWYVRPEDQNPGKSMEEKNNKEPDSQKFIEITIEDSPIKPAPSKRTKEIANTTAINIDDSPIKGPESGTQNEEKSSDSDENTPLQPRGTPNSKKKLQYSKQVAHKTVEGGGESTEGTSNVPVTIEIEIPPLEVEVAQIAEDDEKIANRDSNENDNNIVIEIQESPAKKRNKQHVVKANKSPVSNDTTDLDKSTEPAATASPTENTEFHPTYQSFIDLCFKLENSEDMKKIVEKKIKTYYLQVPKEYRESEEFLEMVSSKIMSMKAGPEKMYLYIKDIVDELNLQRKLAKAKDEEKEKEQEKAAIEFYGEEIEADTKRKRQVRKLEKTLKKLNRAIHKLEEQEVDFDDDGDSVYILTESEDEIETTSGKDRPNAESDKPMLLQRYKERLVRVHAKLCQLSNTKMPSEPRVQIEQRPGKPAGPAKRLEKWINKRVPVGTPLPFPDFHDVLRCVREANEEDKLGWNEVDVMEEARDLFTRCGKKLQRRRQENEWRLAASRLPPDADPAETSELLKRKLDENRKISSQKEAELINRYADRQKQLQLEAVEIGDKEAEESPVESGDEAQEEEKQEEKTLESTEGRKERLKRLLKERSKGATKNSKPIELDDDEDDIAVSENTDKGDIKSPEEVQKNVDVAIKPSISDEACIAVDEPSDNIEANAPKDSLNRSGENNDIHSLSDGSKDDGDELNLLQKLHSGTDFATSTVDSSDTDTPIAISDTLGSSDDVQKKGSKNSSDVVSIENSSYSESEALEKEDPNIEDEVILDASEAHTKDHLEEKNLDPDKCSPKKSRNSNDEYTEPLEDILLASSDDEDTNQEEQSKTVAINVDNDDSFVNLKDDSISIGDTVIEGSGDPNSGSREEVASTIQPENRQLGSVIANSNLNQSSVSVDEDSGERGNENVEDTTQIGDELLEEAKSIDDREAELCGEPNGVNINEGRGETRDDRPIGKAEEKIDDGTVVIEIEIEPDENNGVLETNEVIVGSNNPNDDNLIELLSNLIDDKTQDDVEPEQDDADLVKSVEPITSKAIEALVNTTDDVITEKDYEPKIDTITNKSEDAGNSEKVPNITMEVESVATGNGDIPDNDITDQIPMANESEVKSMDIDPIEAMDIA